MKIILYVIVLLSTIPCFADQRDSLYFSPGINYQGHLFGEICATYGIRSFNHGLPTLNGVRFGSEFSVMNNKIVVGPKVSYELSAVFLGFRGSIIAYMLKGQPVAVRIVPEMGISFLTYGNIFYGLNIPVTKQIDELGWHRVTLSLYMW